MAKLTYKTIPRFIDWGNYQIDVSFRSLVGVLERYEREYGLDLDPDFQRAHVWTEAQQRAYVEFVVRGGRSGKVLLFNAKGWNGSGRDVGPIVLVDGKQRLNAVLRFLRDELTIFDDFDGIGPTKCSEMEVLRELECRFQFFINGLNTRSEVLEWYLQLNGGGTPHTEAELDKVRAMRNAELMDLKTGDIVEVGSPNATGCKTGTIGAEATADGKREVLFEKGWHGYYRPEDLKLIRRAQ